MAFKLYEDVWETTTGTGTGDLVLAGAVTGFYTFSSQYANADTCHYSINDGTNREVGLGTYNSGANSLTRTTVYRSTNSNNAVNWGAGTKQVMVAPLGYIFEQLWQNNLVRAHVNFNGTGTVAIRGTATNVSSITDNGVGDYTLNFTTAFPSANYTYVFGTDNSDGFMAITQKSATAPTTTALRVQTAGDSSAALVDFATVCVACIGG